MKKSILITTALIATLTTGAFAYNQNKANFNCQNMQQGKMQNKQMKKRMNHQRYGKHKGGMTMFSQLNLSDKQRYELSILKDEMRLEIKKSRGYMKQNRAIKSLSEDGFNKKEFIKLANEEHNKRLNLKANFMEKAFKILTKEQISQLKTLASK